MSRATFKDRCLHCGLEYTSGDCREFTCPKCKANGHRGMHSDCNVCRRENQWSRPIDANGTQVDHGIWYFAYDGDLFIGAGRFAVSYGDWGFFINGTQYEPATFTYKPAGENPQPNVCPCGMETDAAGCPNGH